MKRKMFSMLAALAIGCSGPNQEILTHDAGKTSSSSSSSSSSGDVQVLNPKLPPSGSFDLFSPDDTPITYMGGAVMTQPVTVYYIWYGDWSNNPKTAPILEDMIKDIDATPWYQINTKYYQHAHISSGVGIHPIYVNKKVSFGSSISVEYPYGNSLTSNQVFQVVTDSLESNQLPTDDNAVYFVLTSKDVTTYMEYYELCIDYCGWHNNAMYGAHDIKYSAIGDLTRCSDACTMQSSYYSYGFVNSPNDDWSADSMSTVILHELSETVTDPNVETGWVDRWGSETADHCAWVFGDLYLSKNNSVANVKIGNRDFLIQKNWVLEKQACGLHL